MQSVQTYHVKVALNDVRRRFALKDPSFYLLSNQVATLFQTELHGAPFTLRYVDDEKHLVTLSSDEELNFAFGMFGGSLNLEVTAKTGEKHSQLTPQPVDLPVGTFTTLSVQSSSQSSTQPSAQSSVQHTMDLNSENFFPTENFQELPDFDGRNHFDKSTKRLHYFKKREQNLIKKLSLCDNDPVEAAFLSEKLSAVREKIQWLSSENKGDVRRAPRERKSRLDHLKSKESQIVNRMSSVKNPQRLSMMAENLANVRAKILIAEEEEETSKSVPTIGSPKFEEMKQALDKKRDEVTSQQEKVAQLASIVKDTKFLIRNSDEKGALYEQLINSKNELQNAREELFAKRHEMRDLAQNFHHTRGERTNWRKHRQGKFGANY